MPSFYNWSIGAKTTVTRAIVSICFDHFGEKGIHVTQRDRLKVISFMEHFFRGISCATRKFVTVQPCRCHVRSMQEEGRSKSLMFLCMLLLSETTMVIVHVYHRTRITLLSLVIGITRRDAIKGPTLWISNLCVETVTRVPRVLGSRQQSDILVLSRVKTSMETFVAAKRFSVLPKENRYKRSCTTLKNQELCSQTNEACVR